MINQPHENIKFIEYCRKSSEAEDRQILSIESQIEENAKAAMQQGVEVKNVEIITESKSAKNAFGRPAFEELYKKVESGQAQGIIAWNANRLSRNAIDAARLVDLFDKGKLKMIVTQQQVFQNTPQDKFMFTLFCSQAKMENDNKSIDVGRGLRKKCSMGIPTWMAPVGFINDYGKKGEAKWLVDPERHGIVRQTLELFLTGNYSVRQLHEYSDKKLGLRTRQRDKEGGKPLKLSGFYNMLKNSVYAGFFYYKDENGMVIKQKTHKHIKPMITEDQYWQIQAMIGQKSRPRPSINKLVFAYTGKTKCGTCGGSVTAENKHQLICSNCRLKFAYRNKRECLGCNTLIESMINPTYLHYVYYHCTKRKKPDCPERSVYDTDIDNSLAAYFEENLKISPDLRDWCLKHMNEIDDQEKQNEYEAKTSVEKAIAKAQRECDGLVDMKSKGLLDDADFIRLQAAKKEEVFKLRESLQEFGDLDSRAEQRIKKAFDLAVGVAEVFKKGSFEEKQEALAETRSNLTLKDKNISIIHDELLSIIIRGRLAAKSENKAFEPANWRADKRKNTNIAADVPSWLRLVNAFRTVNWAELEQELKVLSLV